MADVKFSEFVPIVNNILPGDQFAGLRSGVNTIFTSQFSEIQPCRLISLNDLDATYNNGSSGVGATLTANNNGVLLIDGVNPSVGDRICVQGQNNLFENGIYEVNDTGSVSTPFIIVRTTDFDDVAYMTPGRHVLIYNGDDYAGSIYVLLYPQPAAIGTDDIIFYSMIQISLTTYDFLQSANDLSDVANPATALANLSGVNLGGDTMTGYLTLVGDPINPLEASTKQYVDSVASGLVPKASCYVSTTANLNATYNNGAAGVGATLTNNGALAAFSSDGESPAINSRVLVAFQTNAFQNGIYTLTTVGSGAVAWVLTRATDYDTAAEVTVGSTTIVINGTSYGGTQWVQTATVATMGTDDIDFVQLNSSSAIVAGTGLDKTGNTISLLNPVALNLGGTNAALTADLGGIVYSTASALAILASTATAGQMLRSGSSAAPTWSTTVWPNTVTANNLLYASGTNTVAGLATANNGVLVTSAGGVPSIGSTLPSAVQGNITSLGTITSGTWNGSLIGLTYGGTNANLTASDGGIVYSTATALAILNATATARQMLQSGASGAPTWSTATWPATTTANALLFSSATNTVGEVTSSASATLITSAGSVPSFSQTLPSAVQNNITSLGTITSGVWNGSIIPSQYGGTGVNNASSTITIGGNVTFSGAFTTAFTVTGNTALTLPTTGTLVNDAVTTLSSLSSVGTITTGVWNATPVQLAYGGTNANLTASNGGIVYSTATAMAILSATATARQMLQSGASGAPAWSTTTWPATSTANRILYSSSTNVIGEITSANSAVLLTNSSGVPSFSGTMTNGQLIIGSTGGTPTAAVLTAGSGISITNGAGSISIAATGSSGVGGFSRIMLLMGG